MTTSAPTWVRKDGFAVPVHVEGDGQPLLMVMGLGGNTDMWHPLRQRLDGYTTISFDSPGTGRAPNPRRPITICSLARLARSVLDAIGVERADVLGYSFGGAIAQQLAIQHPARVRRLVLAATNLGLLSIPPMPRRIAHMLTPRRYHSDAYFRRVAPDLFGGRLAREPETLEADFRLRHHHPPTTWGYLAHVAAISTWTSLPWVHRIRQPALVLAADDDPLVPLANARILARLLPNGRLHVLPGGGHLFLLDDPARAAPVIRDFLAPERS